jgi:hypothetical protein
MIVDYENAKEKLENLIHSFWEEIENKQTEGT